jgi:predicted RNA methylase
VLKAVHGCDMEAVADLGCGDGRVLVHAARMFELRDCWGVELDEELIQRACEAAREVTDPPSHERGTVQQRGDDGLLAQTPNISTLYLSCTL